MPFRSHTVSSSDLALDVVALHILVRYRTHGVHSNEDCTNVEPPSEAVTHVLDTILHLLGFLQKP